MLRGDPASPESEAHVRACAECARSLVSDERLIAAIGFSLERVVDTPPSPDFVARVRGRVAEERTRVAYRQPWLIGAAASLPIALALVTLSLMNPWGPTSHDSGPASRASALARSAEQPRIADARAATPQSVTPADRPRATRRRRERDGPAVAGRVFVEPGQPEALARLVRGLGTAPASAFAIGGASASTPLPELRPADLPRLEMKPLVLKALVWEGPTWEGWGNASDSNEGSGS